MISKERDLKRTVRKQMAAPPLVLLFVSFLVFAQNCYTTDSMEVALEEELGVEDYFFKKAVAESPPKWGQRIGQSPSALPVTIAEGIKFSDEDDGFARGVEFEPGYRWTDWPETGANYTFEKMYIEKEKQAEHPEDKLSVGARAELKNGLSIELQAHRVDEHVMASTLSGEQAEPSAHTGLGIRVAKEFLEGDMEVALVGQNVLDPKHPESFVIDVDRNVYFTVSWKFGRGG